MTWGYYAETGPRAPRGSGRRPDLGNERAGRVTRALRNVQVAVHRSRHRWLSPGSVVATNLYNARPSQLADAHATLDQAVWSAYGLPEPPEETDDETILARRVALNLEQSST